MTTAEQNIQLDMSQLEMYMGRQTILLMATQEKLAEAYKMITELQTKIQSLTNTKE